MLDQEEMLHGGHRQRLKKRFITEGLQSFEEHNALELLLFYAFARCDTNELAHRLIARFGSFAGVADAPLEELLEVPGIGENAATLIKLVPQLSAFYQTSRSRSLKVITSTADLAGYFSPRFVGKRSEEVHLLSLDDKRMIIRCKKLFEGTVNATPITVKKVVAEAISANATAVVLAHNHPGGVALPSSNDRYVTRKAFMALNLINIQLLDHLIVTDDDCVSMRDSGEFMRYEEGAN